MSALAAILDAKVRMGRHAVASIRNESRLKVAVVTVAVIVLWLGAWVGFREAFLWLRGFEVPSRGERFGVGDIILLRLLSVFSLALFFMLVFSNILIAFSTLYRSAEVAWLLQAPLGTRELFLARFAECVVFSSWASAYLGSPLILAYGLVMEAPWPFYAAAVLAYVPFVTIPAALGAMIAMVFLWVYPRLPRGTLPLVAMIGVTVLFFYLRGIINADRLSEDAVFATNALPAVFTITARTQSPWLPSQWASQGLLMASSGAYGRSVFYLLLLAANAFFAVWLAAGVAQRAFYAGWSGFSGKSNARIRPHGRGLLGILERGLVVLPDPWRSLSVKDAKLFWRDPTQWAQFLIFFGIMAVYIGSVRSRDTPGYEQYRMWIASMNIAASTLILATLTSRFVYPLVSLEGRRFWILGLAPVTLRQIIWQKFWLSVVTTSLFTVGLVVLSCIRLRVAPIPFALAVFSIVVTNFGLSGLAVGLGSLYPNFHEDNPARIVSGMGGTLNFLASMGYITLVVGAQTLILQWHALEAYTRPGMFWWALSIVLVLITLLSAGCTLIPMTLGLRNLQRAEY
jgi:ABC-2 type transport system permease protein